MTKRLNNLILISFKYLIFCGALLSCEESFNPQLDPKYENLLVVEGEITNSPGPYVIKLSYAVSLNSIAQIPATGATVVITDDFGNNEPLFESTEGTYLTSTAGFHGIAGRQYKISITLPNGKSYTSDFQLLKTPPVISLVYPQVEYQIDETLPYDLAGYRFYVNAEIPAGETVYYLWKLTSTFKYSADLIIRWIYDGQLRPFTNFDSLRYCWSTNRISSFYLFHNENLEITELNSFPLHFVGTDVRDLSIRYSLLTEQYSISKIAYEFWSKVKEQNESLGELYSKQPFQIRGNVFNPENADEPVLGFFMVAGKSEHRIFVNRPEAPVIMRYGECVLVEQDYMNFGTIFLSTPAEWPEFATIDINGSNAYPPQSCLDCRENGGVIEKPDFWIDN